MNGPLPDWLARFLDLPEMDSSDGVVPRLENTWNWPAWVTLVFIVGAATFVLWAYLTEKGAVPRWLRLALATVRIALIGLALMMIAEWRITRTKTGLPYLVLAIDESASMAQVDPFVDEKLRTELLAQLKSIGLEEPNRLNLAKAIITAGNGRLLKEIEHRFRLKVYFLSEVPRAQSVNDPAFQKTLRELPARGAASRLGAGVRKILDDLRDAPPAAIVLFTDGINTDGETLSEAAVQAKRKGVPIFTVGLGSEQPLRDLELSDLQADELAFLNDILTFDGKLTSHGFEGKSLEITLKDKATGKALTQKTVVAGKDGQFQRVRLQYRPTVAGRFDFVVEVTPFAEEATAANNSAQRTVTVRKEQVKVLLVQAYPSYEFRFLKNLLQRDTHSIALKTVLQDADVEYADVDKTALRVFPVRREDLFAYDVVILGDVNPALLSGAAKQNLADFVTVKGGGLIVIAGPKFTPQALRDTPLAPLLPIDLDGVKSIPVESKNGYGVVPTEIGLNSPQMQLGDSPAETAQIWGKLSELYGFCEAPLLKAGALVLAEHPTLTGEKGQKLPVIAMQYAGAGKVIFHATDDTYRWRARVGDVYFARYWIQTIRYLSRAKLLGLDGSAELTADRREYQRGEAVRLRVRFTDERQAPPQDDGVSLMIEQQGAKKHRLTLTRNATQRGVFEGTFLPTTDGPYHASLITPTLTGVAPAADFVVSAPAGELQRLQMDVAELRKMADETNGRFYTIATAGRLEKELPQGRSIVLDTQPPLPLWNRWPVLLLFLVLIITEWIGRKSQGLM